MTIVRTQELYGDALDWAVAIALGYKAVGSVAEYGYTMWRTPEGDVLCYWFSPSRQSVHCQGIIERNLISTHSPSPETFGQWWACIGVPQEGVIGSGGPTPMIAAMRCLVEHKLGDEVDIPDDILEPY